MNRKLTATIIALSFTILLAACSKSGNPQSESSANSSMPSTLPPVASEPTANNSNSVPSSTPSNVGATSPETATEPVAQESKEITFGDMIYFDDLEIIFSDEITWTTLDNQYSDKDGMDVFLVPVTIKNVKGETHGLNIFYCTQYGSNGTELDNVGAYFDNEIGIAGDMRYGAVQESVMAFLYDGDGDYYVEFSSIGSREMVEIKLPISMADYLERIDLKRTELAEMYATYIHNENDMFLPLEANKKYWYAIFSAPLNDILELDQSDFKNHTDVISFLAGYFAASDANYLNCGWDINQWSPDKDLALSTEWAAHSSQELEMMDGSVITMTEDDEVFFSDDGSMYFGDKEVADLHSRNAIGDIAFATLISDFKKHFGTSDEYTLGDLLFFSYRSLD